MKQNTNANDQTESVDLVESGMGPTRYVGSKPISIAHDLAANVRLFRNEVFRQVGDIPTTMMMEVMTATMDDQKVKGRGVKDNVSTNAVKMKGDAENPVHLRRSANVSVLYPLTIEPREKHNVTNSNTIVAATNTRAHLAYSKLGCLGLGRPTYLTRFSFSQREKLLLRRQM